MTVQPARPGVAVAARELSKNFTIQTASATSLKEIIVRGFVTHRETTTYRALDNISFELAEGRSLAIAGSNGSGKSTLLKLISGISQPTSGVLEVRGRVAALLELGAGFHTELTGMENIFLQGSILGLSRAQILERLDDILEFCELGGFIHTPMKRYSSGMTIRLGFALAVFSDADILLIDEVLAVGDAAFQAKCLRKITELRARGKTIIFVSHFVQHIEAVADEILWLEKGRIVAHGPLDEVLPTYLERLSGSSTNAPDVMDEEMNLSDRRHQFLMASRPHGVRAVPKGAVIDSVCFLNGGNQPTQLFETNKPMQVEVTYTIHQPLDPFDVQLGYAGPGDVGIAWQSARAQGLALSGEPGTRTVRMRIEKLPFLPGRYRMGVALVKSLGDYEFYDMHFESHVFQVRGRATNLPPASTPPGEFAN